MLPLLAAGHSTSSPPHSMCLAQAHARSAGCLVVLSLLHLPYNSHAVAILLYDDHNSWSLSSSPSSSSLKSLLFSNPRAWTQSLKHSKHVPGTELHPQDNKHSHSSPLPSLLLFLYLLFPSFFFFWDNLNYVSQADLKLQAHPASAPAVGITGVCRHIQDCAVTLNFLTSFGEFSFISPEQAWNNSTKAEQDSSVTLKIIDLSH